MVTVTSGVKDEPVIVTGVPTGPDVGLSEIEAPVVLGVTVNKA